MVLPFDEVIMAAELGGDRVSGECLEAAAVAVPPREDGLSQADFRGLRGVLVIVTIRGVQAGHGAGHRQVEPEQGVLDMRHGARLGFDSRLPQRIPQLLGGNRISGGDIGRHGHIRMAMPVRICAIAAHVRSALAGR